MKRILSLLLSVLLTVSGCATTRQAVPHFSTKIDAIKTVAVMPPQVKMYQFQAGGTVEEMDKWNAQVRQVIVAAIDEYLSRENFNVKFVDEQFLYSQHRQLWADTEVLYEAVAASAFAHTLGKQKFPAKVKYFDYTLGKEIGPMADSLGVDTFLFVYGYDHVSTKGRVALKAFNTLASVALSVAAGGVFIYPPEHSPTFLSMGLVDGQSGELLWFKIIPGNRGQNFLNPEEMTKIIQWMIEDLKEPSTL